MIPFVPRLIPESLLIWHSEILAHTLPPVPIHHANIFAISTSPKINGTVNTFVQEWLEAHHEFASWNTQQHRLNQESFLLLPSSGHQT